MRHRAMIPLAAFLTTASLVAGIPGLAQKAPARATARPATARFTEAAATWADIEVQTKDLAQLIREKRLDEVHPVAFEIRDLVRTLPDKSRALPAASRTKLAAQVRMVDRLAEQLDRYGDAGKQAETARQAQRLSGVLGTIRRLYPAGALLNPTGTAAGATGSAKERALYLTPGGAYTAADIKANGNALPAQKFRGIKVNHDLKPKVGDRICPITLTKANPGYTWIIGGKEYQFCCPPCVEEFLTKAKQDPASLQPPDAFIKKAG